MEVANRVMGSKLPKK